MDELKNVWAQIELPDEKSKYDDTLMHKTQNHQFVRIRKGLDFKRYSNFFMIGLIIITLIMYQDIYFDLAMSMLLLGHLITAVFLNKMKRILDLSYDSSKPPLEFVRTYYEKAVSLIRFDQWSGLMLYPFSILSGLLLGLKLSGTSYLIDTREFWVWVFVIYTVLIPILHYVTRLLNQRTFGPHLESLRKTMDDLSVKTD